LIFITFSDIKITNFCLFLLGPGFSLLFIQYRSFLSLSLLLFLSVFLKGRVRYFQYLVAGLHISIISAFFANEFKNKYLSLRYSLVISALQLSLLDFFVNVGVYPSISDYSPENSLSSFSFLIFCWIYIISLESFYGNNKRKPHSMKKIHFNSFLFIIFVGFFMPFIAISTRFWATHASFVLLKSLDLGVKDNVDNNAFSKIKILFFQLLVLLPTIFFFIMRQSNS
jgi:hypothetical protein